MNHGIFFLHLTALIFGIVSNILLFLTYFNNRKKLLSPYNFFWGNFTLLFLYNFLSSYGDVTGWSVRSAQIPLSLMGIALKLCLIIFGLKLLVRFPKGGGRKSITLFASAFMALIGVLLGITLLSSVEIHILFKKINRLSDVLLLVSLTCTATVNRVFLQRKAAPEDPLLIRTNLVLLFFALISLLIRASNMVFNSVFFFWNIFFVFLCFYGLWSFYLILFLSRILFRREIPSLDNLDEDVLDKRGITKREKEILQDLVKGLNRREIAEKEFISPRTVDNHVGRIYRKFEVNGRVELIRKLLRE